jgi:hypothetical protein
MTRGSILRRKALRAAGLFAAVAALVVPTATAYAQSEGAVGGGSGGRYFRYSCGPSRVLVGLKGSAGVLVDNVQAICARVDATGHLSDAQPMGRRFGNDRPQDQDVRCPDQMAITGGHIVENENYPQVGSIALYCHEVANLQFGGSSTITLRGTGNLKGYESPFFFQDSTEGGQNWWDSTTSSCAGSFAKGIHGRQGDNLTAFGVLCGRPGKPEVEAVENAPAAAPLLDPAFAPLVNTDSSFQTVNFPDRYIRHADYLGFVDAPHGDNGSITFRMVPGLGGRCVSLMSTNVANHYLRHQNWRVKLSAIDSDANMRADATFCPVPGLSNTNGITFEAMSAPGHFIRHRNFELWVDSAEDSDQFRKDATFLAAPPGGALLGVR